MTQFACSIYLTNLQQKILGGENTFLVWARLNVKNGYIITVLPRGTFREKIFLSVNSTCRHPESPQIIKKAQLLFLQRRLLILVFLILFNCQAHLPSQSNNVLSRDQGNMLSYTLWPVFRFTSDFGGRRRQVFLQILSCNFYYQNYY